MKAVSGGRKGRWASVVASAGLVALAAMFALLFVGPVVADSQRESGEDPSGLVRLVVDLSSFLRENVLVVLPLAACLVVVTVVAFVIAVAGTPTRDGDGDRP